MEGNVTVVYQAEVCRISSFSVLLRLLPEDVFYFRFSLTK
jgi:hypothetical protein